MNFQEKLDLIVLRNNSLICVGLDPQFDRLPASVLTQTYPLLAFNKAIIDATHDLVCAYKPNTAFYEALGDHGITQLQMTCEYIKTTYPHIPVLIDAKRGDIGTTNEGYVKFVYDYLGGDAVTLHPYLGHEALKPFLQIGDKGCFILCHTSNPGADELQELMAGDTPLYKVVAEKVIKDWNQQKNCALVIGATYPEALAEIRKMAPDMTFLVPGVGAQGGDIQRIVQAGINRHKTGLVINASRSILYASSGTDFATRARQEAQKLRDEINKYRS